MHFFGDTVTAPHYSVAPNPPDIISVRRQLWATLGARDVMVSGLQQLCWKYNVRLDMQRDSGWFETVYYVTLTGERSAVAHINAQITRWADE